MEEAIKTIVVCADDFGLDAAVDAAVLELGNMGRLNATTCLVDGRHFATGAGELARSGLQAGLHLNFTEAFHDAGWGLPLGRLIARAYARQLDVRRVRKEVSRQLDSFEHAFGRAPDFVDGHQHVHQLPVIRDALIVELQRRYERCLTRPWVRYTAAGRLHGIPLSQKLKAFVIQTLGADALARRCRAAGLPTNRRFLGVYGFEGGEEGYSALLRPWLASALDGDVIMCHPACDVVTGDAIAGQRVAEFRAWRRPEVGVWMQASGLRLERAPRP